MHLRLDLIRLFSEPKAKETAAQKTRRSMTELVKASKELMQLGFDLISFSLNSLALISRVKPTQKSQKKTTKIKKKVKNLIAKHYVQFVTSV